MWIQVGWPNQVMLKFGTVCGCVNVCCRVWSSILDISLNWKSLIAQKIQYHMVMQSSPLWCPNAVALRLEVVRSYELLQVPVGAALWYVRFGGEFSLSFKKSNTSSSDHVSSPVYSCCGGNEGYSGAMLLGCLNSRNVLEQSTQKSLPRVRSSFSYQCSLGGLSRETCWWPDWPSIAQGISEHPKQVLYFSVCAVSKVKYQKKVCFFLDLVY